MAGMNGRVQTQDVEGTVEAVNRTGIKIGGAWVNVSQFHPIDMPDVGAHVRLKVDAKGYIRQVESESESEKTPAIMSDRDERIARLAVLKAAAGFGASRPDMKSGDVLVLAERWLAWVEQSGRVE